MVHQTALAETIAVYDRSAAEFAARTGDFWPERALRRFQEYTPMDAWVLDAGSGPGRDSRNLAGLGYRLAALDLSAGMLREGQRLGLAAHGAAVVQGEMRRLPFASRSFLGVWACASLLHLPRHELHAALTEFGRVLCAGCLYLALKEGEGEGWQDGPFGARFFTYYRPAQVAQALQAAGFLILESWVNDPGAGRQPWLNYLAWHEEQT
jgi:SAM-dependent methyltransferase